MSVYKQQCFFCTDTVSTGKLNQSYYKMHLENVHGIQLNSDKLLTWTLSQQNLTGKGGGGGSTLSSVASILGMKGITITKDSSSPSNGVPNSLINIKGITVQKVSDDISMTGSPVTGVAPGRGGARGVAPGAARGGARPTAQQTNIARQQEQAIERWSNACEHGCRMCRREGKNFTTFHRNTLLRHLQANHSTSERDYKEEFKCQNLITRASNMTCMECKHKVKRIPSSLSSHCKRHGMTIRQYWLKHVAPKGSAIATYSNGSYRGSPQMRGGRGGWVRGTPPGRGGRGGMTPQFRGGVRPQVRPQQGHNAGKMNGLQPKVMLNRVDDDTIAREEAGMGEDAMEVELDPLTLLEMGMGEDVIQLEGVAVKEEPVDSPAEAGDEEEMSSVMITPDNLKTEAGDSRDLVTPEMYEDAGDPAEDTETSTGGDINSTEDTTQPEDSTADDAAATSPPPAETSADAEEEQKPAVTPVNKHSIGSILSSEHKEAESKPEPSQSKQYSQDSTPSTISSEAAPPPSIAPPPPPSPTVASPSAITAPAPVASSGPPVATTLPSAPIIAKKSVPPPAKLPPASQKAGFPAVTTSSAPYPAVTTASAPYPAVTTASIPYTAPNFHQPPQQQPFQGFPPPPPAPPAFQPFQGSHPAYAPFPPNTTPNFGNAYPPQPHGYPAPPSSGYAPPTSQPFPPVTQHGYPQPNFVPNQQQPQFQQKTRWDTLSCPYSIAQCPLYCCHVRGMQELEEGRTDWSRPYGPPASGFGDRCTCCINA